MGDFDSVKSNWVKVDVSDWVREWRSDKESNIGIRIKVKSAGKTMRLAAPDFDNENADLRPRLSLSCHGDQVDPSAVFKATSTDLVVPDAEMASATTTLRLACRQILRTSAG